MRFNTMAESHPDARAQALCTEPARRDKDLAAFPSEDGAGDVYRMPPNTPASVTSQVTCPGVVGLGYEVAVGAAGGCR